MRMKLLLATLTAILLVGAPHIATAVEHTEEPQTQSESADRPNFVDPDAGDDSSGLSDTDREGGDSVDRDEPSDPGGGSGGDDGGTD